MINFTKGQENAIQKAKEWWNCGDPQKPYFVLQGLAGTGKTTVLAYLVNELGMRENTAFATYTGKAAMVLSKKGLPAATIHRLIYKLEDDTVRLEFSLVDSLPDHIKLVVIDEYSMLNDKIFDDLLSFHIPVIFCGDPRQLPPVEDVLTKIQEADAFLDEIVRQEADNPIVLLAHDILKTGDIPAKDYGEKVKIFRFKKAPEDLYTYADQVLCYKNATRKDLNQKIREMRGLSGVWPTQGDKLICTKNNWDLGFGKYPLINGAIGFARSNVVANKNGDLYALDLLISPDYSPSASDIFKICKEPFQKLEWFDKRDRELTHWDFAQAITVHKAQGSEFDKVLVFDDAPRKMLSKEDLTRWLYTAVTRAKEELIYVR